MLITCWRNFKIDDFLSSFIISIVPNHIALESVMMNGILLMYIISMVNIMLPCSSRIPSGRSSSVLSITLVSVFLVDCLLGDPRLGPSKSSALGMSCFVMGQL